MHKSQRALARRIIQRVNALEPGAENQTKTSKTGEIKVGGLSHRRAKQSDPRLAWRMHIKLLESTLSNHPIQTKTLQEMHAWLQCNVQKEKKAAELGMVQDEAMNLIPFVENETNEVMTIVKAKQDTSRNLLVRSVAYNIMKQTLLLPSQEIKQIQQEHFEAKSIKIINSLEVSEQSRMNPDMFSGLFSCEEVRAKARAVQKAKNTKKVIDKEKQEETLIKNARLMSKKAEAFEKIVNSVRISPTPLKEVLLKHNTTDLKLVYQHLITLLST